MGSEEADDGGEGEQEKAQQCHEQRVPDPPAHGLEVSGRDHASVDAVAHGRGRGVSPAARRRTQ